VVEVRARARIEGTRPNLIVIAIDTLREDRTGLLSEPDDRWDLTPNLRERLAGRGTVFSRAYSQAPWTMPAFASIFTGLYPEEHGAQRGEDRLLPRQLTLAELLRDAGYRTMAVVSGEYVSSRVGMLQGFDRRDESQVLDHDAITSSEVTDRALAFLSAHRDEPFFLFAHYFDPHWVYREHEEFDFTTAEWSGPPSPKLRLVIGIRNSVDHMTASDRARLAEVEALYAEDIAFADLHIGRLLAALDEGDLWDTTCVVVVADHGEEFLEHGGLEHGQTLFNEVVQVPLFVADPSRAVPEVVSDVVETRWLFGTIVDMLGVGPPAARGSAHSLFAPERDGERYARSSLTNSQSCLIGSQYKLIRGAHRRSMPLPEREFEEAAQSGRPRQDLARGAVLFDLHSDPEESLDLSSDLPEVKRRLQSSLDSLDARLRSTARAQPMPRLNRDQLRRLKDLGYL
jgi:arylsulfatase A-like enzyme